MLQSLLPELQRGILYALDLFPIGVVGIISWSVWLIRRTTSKFYRPLINEYRTTTSVVVPSYREDPDIQIQCLETWLSEEPTEIIIVPDIADVDLLERLEAYADNPRVRVVPFKHQGKRSALGVGIEMARHDVVVLADSDTAWEPGLLAALQMPFVDPKVGGVGTRQNAILRDSSVWRRVADWLVNIRYLDYVPAQGMAGSVACLSGRTAAYRRSAILPVVDKLENEYFLGRKCVAGDDGRLTWLVLGAGYKTVYQGSAQAWSMFPNSFRAFVKQRVRWSRNSYRCYLTAMYNGWLWQQPLITQISVLQIVLTPVSMFFGLFFVFLALFEQQWAAFAFGLAWVFVGRAIRSISHLREHPKDIVLLPLVTLVVIFISLPIKTWALISMNKQGWLTRTSTQIGGDGQNVASLQSANTAGTIAESPLLQRALGES